MEDSLNIKMLIMNSGYVASAFYVYTIVLLCIKVLIAF